MAGLNHGQFDLGQTFDHAFIRTVTEMDNTMLSLMTMNPQPSHLGARFAEKAEFGQHLFNSLGIMVGMAVHDTTLGTAVANLGMTDARFPKPAFHGDMLRARTAA